MLVYFYTMKYYEAIKMNELDLNVTQWINL